MKMLLKIVLGLVVIVAVVLVIALFIKKEYTIQREVTINKPAGAVFEYIRHLKNQDNFSKWVMTDPGMKRNFTGVDGTPGFVYAWDSQNKQAGKGEQEIISIKENKELDIEIRFEKPFKNVAHTPFTTDALSANETKVTWSMVGRNPYPMNIMNLFLGGMLGKDMETSLLTLKGILERSQAETAQANETNNQLKQHN